MLSQMDRLLKISLENKIWSQAEVCLNLPRILSEFAPVIWRLPDCQSQNIFLI